jgi:hypothetical protein
MSVPQSIDLKMKEEDDTLIAEIPRLKGLLKMLNFDDPLHFLHFDALQLNETQTILERRRKKVRNREMRATDDYSSDKFTFQQLVARNRFVCFFIVQGSGNYHSIHTLNLRKKLAMDYHDSMTTFLISLDGKESDNSFCEGTGFAIFPFFPMATRLLNVTQVPAIVVIDSTTGRPLSSDAALAVEWNDPHFVINAWQRKKSGLSCSQKAFSVLTFQSTCTIS